MIQSPKSKQKSQSIVTTTTTVLMNSLDDTRPELSLMASDQLDQKVSNIMTNSTNRPTCVHIDNLDMEESVNLLQTDRTVKDCLASASLPMA